MTSLDPQAPMAPGMVVVAVQDLLWWEQRIADTLAARDTPDDRNTWLLEELQAWLGFLHHRHPLGGGPQ